MKRHFIVTFRRSNWKVAEFLCLEESPEEALEDARRRFQWAFGYWPDPAISIEEKAPESPPDESPRKEDS